MGRLRKHLLLNRKLSNKSGIFPITLVLCTMLAAVCLSSTPINAAMEIADEPMMAQIKAAPANIMIVLDDSGSMTFEILVKGEYDGQYPDPDDGTGKEGYCYIFPDLGDNNYSDSWRWMSSDNRKYWKSQYSGVNVMYYNPATTYEPWPDYPGQTFSDADMDNPKPHPLKTGTTTLKLDAESFTSSMEGGPDLTVKHAHYFVEDTAGDVWLVVIDGEPTIPVIKYYKVTQFDGTGLEEKVKKIREETPPAGSGIISGRTYSEERQNFANWFTYHRRREYVAKSAIARVINNLRGVRMGILGINGKIIVPLKPLGVWKSAVYQDQRNDLLQELYDYDSRGGTPLREGLNDVGQYYKNNSLTLEHYKGTSVTGAEPPYYSEADGGACQQSFTIVMTDGYYSYDQSPGVNNADGDNNTTWDGGFYADARSNTLADVAMYYYENDLRTDLPDQLNDPQRLNPSALDTARHQHMVTFGVAFGVTGNLTPDDYNDDPISPDYLKDGSGSYPTWPITIPERSKDTIDDLYHATVNGRGDFLTAKDPEELADSLLELMNNILARLGSASAVSTNGDSLYGKVSDDVLMFQASYKTNDWSGDVKAYEVDTTTGRVFLETPKWSAAESLAAIAWDSRNILTYDGSSGAEFDPAESAIDWNASLGSDYVNIINYVRGQPDIPGFRVRNSLLGDIVHSSPIFEEDFVYVGANDGMLHAFEITVTKVSGTRQVSGQERFAYVPSFVFDNLVNLTETAMVHKFFVDLTPKVVSGEGLLGGSGSQTILVGGLGKGGKGYFALDITDPANMGTDDVLWEFPNDATSSEVSDMGYSFSKPVVVQTNSTTASEAWVVITGNGYDSPDGRAVLYILNPLTGEVTRKITTLDTDSDNGLSSPIAVDVNFDRKVDFVYAGDLKGNMWKFDLTDENSSNWSVAYYSGSPTPSNQPLFQAIGPGGFPQPITSKPEVMFHPRKHGLLVLFGTGKFLGMSDFSNDRGQTVYGIWDYGDRIYYPGAWGAYSNDDDTEYLGTFNRPNLSNFQGKNVELLEQTSKTYSVTIVNINNQTVNTDIRVLSDNQPNWHTVPDIDPLGTNGNPNLEDLAEDPLQTAHGGWFWDLPETGERVVTDVLLRDGRLVVIAFTPNPDRCSDGGSSFLMELNSSTGGVSGGTVFDTNNDGRIDSDDLVTTGVDDEGNEIKKIPGGIKLEGMVQQPAILILNPEVEIKYMSSSTGVVHLVKEKAVRLGVTYWKELDN